MKKENALLETTLSIAERGYGEAYRFLLDAYEQAPQACGPQTLYFLACLAGGGDQPEAALGWLRKAIADNGWWYRPEVLEDDDLAPLDRDPEFRSLKALSDARYADAVSASKALFPGKRKRPVICSWPFTETPRTGRRRGRIGRRYLRETASGRSRPYRAPSRTGTERTGGAMT